MATIKKEHAHRLQLSRAQQYIRQHLADKVTLLDLAKVSGASPYHFIRVFSAYTDETPFSFIRRVKVFESLGLLQQAQLAITDIAFRLGFESASAFNKAFKKITRLNPSEFRNLGEAEKSNLSYLLSMTPKAREISMNLNMHETPELIQRPQMSVFALSTSGGRFDEIAPAVWQDFIKILAAANQDLSESEFLGISEVEPAGNADQPDTFIYKAAVSAPTHKQLIFDDLQQQVLPASKYAKFLLKGSYLGVWPAFDKAFKVINEGPYELSAGVCLENYLNDPSQTAEDELLTEILIPVK